MREFMFIYQGADPEWMQSKTPEDMQAIMGAWAAWMEALQKQDKLVTGGSPLHISGKRVTSQGVVTDIAAAEFKELVSGYSIVRCASIEEACELSRNCPIFENPNIILEVREIMVMPS